VLFWVTCEVTFLRNRENVIILISVWSEKSLTAGWIFKALPFSVGHALRAQIQEMHKDGVFEISTRVI
jgi:hypothetical protein